VTRRRQGSEERPSDVAGQRSETRPFDIEGEVNNLRYVLARASAMGIATQAMIEAGTWGDDADEDRRRMEDLSHLVGAGLERCVLRRSSAISSPRGWPNTPPSTSPRGWPDTGPARSAHVAQRRIRCAAGVPHHDVHPAAERESMGDVVVVHASRRDSRHDVARIP
jgi:hypothetical protein